MYEKLYNAKMFELKVALKKITLLREENSMIYGMMQQQAADNNQTVSERFLHESEHSDQYIFSLIGQVCETYPEACRQRSPRGLEDAQVVEAGIEVDLTAIPETTQSTPTPAPPSISTSTTQLSGTTSFSQLSSTGTPTASEITLKATEALVTHSTTADRVRINVSVSGNVEPTTSAHTPTVSPTAGSSSSTFTATSTPTLALHVPSTTAPTSTTLESTTTSSIITSTIKSYIIERNNSASVDSEETSQMMQNIAQRVSDALNVTFDDAMDYVQKELDAANRTVSAEEQQLREHKDKKSLLIIAAPILAVKGSEGKIPTRRKRFLLTIWALLWSRYCDEQRQNSPSAANQPAADWFYQDLQALQTELETEADVLTQQSEDDVDGLARVKRNSQNVWGALLKTLGYVTDVEQPDHHAKAIEVLERHLNGVKPVTRWKRIIGRQVQTALKWVIEHTTLLGTTITRWSRKVAQPLIAQSTSGQQSHTSIPSPEPILKRAKRFLFLPFLLLWEQERNLQRKIEPFRHTLWLFRNVKNNN